MSQFTPYEIDLTGLSATKALLKAQKRRFPLVVQKVLIEVTIEALAASRDNLATMVYAEPIPLVARRSRKTGRMKKVAAWKRTGQLLAGERMEISGPYETVIYNSMDYAKPRHDLNTPSPIDRRVRKAPWRAKTVSQMRSRIRRRLLAAANAELRRAK